MTHLAAVTQVSFSHPRVITVARKMGSLLHISDKSIPKTQGSNSSPFSWLREVMFKWKKKTFLRFFGFPSHRIHGTGILPTLTKCLLSTIFFKCLFNFHPSKKLGEKKKNHSNLRVAWFPNSPTQPMSDGPNARFESHDLRGESERESVERGGAGFWRMV